MEASNGETEDEVKRSRQRQRLGLLHLSHTWPALPPGSSAPRSELSPLTLELGLYSISWFSFFFWLLRNVASCSSCHNALGQRGKMGSSVAIE